MYSKIESAMLTGINTTPVSVEVDISTGMPMVDMVGYLSSEVKEAKERVRTALHNCNISLPPKRITINIAPANIKKTGTSFDLPIAIALLTALGVIDGKKIERHIFVGELGLNGDLIPVNGILPIVSDNANSQSYFVVSKGNESEAKLIPNANVFSFDNLNEIIEAYNVDPVRVEKYKKRVNKNLNDKNAIQSGQESHLEDSEKELEDLIDFADVNGQLLLKRACEISAAGMHNMLIIGPPGTGKTMISERMSTIMPPLNEEEKLELSKIYSVCGLLKDKKKLVHKRPFRSPHHTVTKAALAGGGINPIPGEISLAHEGVLFLDELTEFQKQTIEVLRQPLEDRKINLTRMNYNVTYPADFLLLSAMNPCNCGYYPNMQKCRCTPASLKRYLNKISQPLLDRIDITIQAPEMRYKDLVTKTKNETSAQIRERVVQCQKIQYERYKNEPFFHNSQIPASRLEEYVKLGEDEANYIEEKFEEEGLTARTYHKILRVSRTIADLDNSRDVKLKHIIEAFTYKGLSANYYKGGME
ncbi:magnesium chelatase family protein [Lachnospiraceae bacterium C7]|nr:magnesium chelatase family protein [Lachnospiraceae bacterium C7]